jgi:hypothetical protein
MLPNEFNATPIDDRAKYLWENGRYIESLPGYYNHNINLYSLHNYYVEVYLEIGTNEIQLIHAVRTEDLQKYLGRIKIDTF